MASDTDAVAAYYDGYTRNDPDAALAVLDPEVTFNPDPELAGGASTLKGYDAVKESWERARALQAPMGFHLEEVSSKPEEMVEGDGVVLVFVRTTARWRQGDSDQVTDLAAESQQLWTMRDGKAVEIQDYIDRGRAIEALKEAGGVSDEELATLEENAKAEPPQVLPSTHLDMSAMIEDAKAEARRQGYDV